MRNHPFGNQSRCAMLGLSLLALLSVPLSADPLYTWAGPGEGGKWDTPANWKTSGGPQKDITPVALGRGGALLPVTTVDRNIVYNGAIANSQDGQTYRNWLRDITIEQDAPAVNQLTLRADLRLGNNLILGASNGGTTVLQLRNDGREARNDSTTALVRLELGYQDQRARHLAINENAVLDFAGTVLDSGTLAATITRGNVALNGGRILLRQGVKSGKENSVLYAVQTDLTIRTGEIVFGAPAITSGHAVSDVRFSVDGTFAMSGGHLSNSTANITQLWLKGAKNFILSNAKIDHGIGIVLGGSGEQEILSAIALPDILLRQNGDGIKTINVSQTGQNIGSIILIQSKDKATATLRLGSDLTLRTGANLPTASHIAAPAANSTVVYEIDTNGHTLNLLANANQWQPNAPRNVRATWRIKGGGTVLVNGVDFSSAGVTVTVEPDTRIKDASGKTIRVP